MARHWGTEVQGNRELVVAATGKMSNKKSKKREGTMQLTGKGHGEGRGNVKGKGKAGSWAEHGLGVEQRGSAVA